MISHHGESVQQPTCGFLSIGFGNRMLFEETLKSAQQFSSFLKLNVSKVLLPCRLKQQFMMANIIFRIAIIWCQNFNLVTILGPSAVILCAAHSPNHITGQDGSNFIDVAVIDNLNNFSCAQGVVF